MQRPPTKEQRRAWANGTPLGRPRLMPLDVAARIATSHHAGATPGQLAAELNAEGIPAPTAPKWTAALVRNALRTHACHGFLTLLRYDAHAPAVIAALIRGRVDDFPQTPRRASRRPIPLYTPPATP